jgi:hypothetical protein
MKTADLILIPLLDGEGRMKIGSFSEQKENYFESDG